MRAFSFSRGPRVEAGMQQHPTLVLLLRESSGAGLVRTPMRRGGSVGLGLEGIRNSRTLGLVRRLFQLTQLRVCICQLLLFDRERVFLGEVVIGVAQLGRFDVDSGCHHVEFARCCSFRPSRCSLSMLRSDGGALHRQRGER